MSKIQQNAYLLANDLGDFIGIVAFDPDATTGKQAVMEAWGTITIVTRELGCMDLCKLAKEGRYPVFTWSHNP